MTVRFLSDLPSTPVKGEHYLYDMHSTLLSSKFLTPFLWKSQPLIKYLLSSLQTPQTVTEKVTKLASSVFPRCFPKAWIRTRANGCTTSSSSPCLPPSLQPVWTAVPRAPGLYLRSKRKLWASNPASPPGWRLSTAAAAQWLQAERRQTSRLSALLCGDLGRLDGQLSHACLFCAVYYLY